MPFKIKCREWDEKRAENGVGTGDPGPEFGTRTIFVYKRNWFVLSQTDGLPFEAEPIPEWDREAAFAILQIQERDFDMTDGNCLGFATKDRKIAISPLAPMPHKTRFHEIAHIALGHVTEGSLSDQESTPRSLREVEAEAVALICCESLRLPGAEYARGYIQNWLGGGEIPPASSQRIFQVADQILKAGMGVRETSS
jgi:hypothetical protein